MGKREKTNEQLALEYLQSKPLNPLEAWTELGIYRLSAVIYNLRKRGHNITSLNKIVYNRFGKRCDVAEYVLVVPK